MEDIDGCHNKIDGEVSKAILKISPITMEDEDDTLQYLIKLEVEEFEARKSGYKIKFQLDRTGAVEPAAAPKWSARPPVGQP